MRASSRGGRTSGGWASTAVALVLLVLSWALVTGGVALLWSDLVDRHGGYVWSPPIVGSSSGHAVISDDIHLDTAGAQWVVDQVVESVRLEVTASEPSDVLFVGVARSADVSAYLRGVAHRQVGDLGQGGAAWGWLGPGVTTDRPGGPPPVPPTDVDIWLTEAIGVGSRTVSWPLADGDWTIVVMNADGGRGVSVTARTGAQAPGLRWIAGGMVLVATGALAAGVHVVRRGTPDAGTGLEDLTVGSVDAGDGRPSADRIPELARR